MFLYPKVPSTSFLSGLFDGTKEYCAESCIRLSSRYKEPLECIQAFFTAPLSYDEEKGVYFILMTRHLERHALCNQLQSVMYHATVVNALNQSYSDIDHGMVRFPKSDMDLDEVEYLAGLFFGKTNGGGLSMDFFNSHPGINPMVDRLVVKRDLLYLPGYTEIHKKMVDQCMRADGNDTKLLTRIRVLSAIISKTNCRHTVVTACAGDFLRRKSSITPLTLKNRSKREPYTHIGTVVVKKWCDDNDIPYVTRDSGLSKQEEQYFEQILQTDTSIRRNTKRCRVVLEKMREQFPRLKKDVAFDAKCVGRKIKKFYGSSSSRV